MVHLPRDRAHSWFRVARMTRCKCRWKRERLLAKINKGIADPSHSRNEMLRLIAARKTHRAALIIHARFRKVIRETYSRSSAGYVRRRCSRRAVNDWKLRKAHTIAKAARMRRTMSAGVSLFHVIPFLRNAAMEPMLPLEALLFAVLGDASSRGCTKAAVIEN